MIVALGINVDGRKTVLGLREGATENATVVMALALEGRFEDYTVGKDITMERVKEIERLAGKHGFRLSGFRSFEHEVTRDQIENVRRNARRAIITGHA